MQKGVIVVYPYPWANERFLHKDVYIFPQTLAKLIGGDCQFMNGYFITGAEKEGQSELVLRLALIVNTVFIIWRIFFGSTIGLYEKRVFILFHVSLPSALIAYALRLRFLNKIKIVVKSDLGEDMVKAATYEKTFLRRKIILGFLNRVDVVTVETTSAFNSLREISFKAGLILCPNGFEAPQGIKIAEVKRSTDVLILSRFDAPRKGNNEYAAIIPLLLKAGFKVEIIGNSASAFISNFKLPLSENLIVHNSLPHSEGLWRMRAAKVFLSLSHYESFLIALIEAYAMGCNIVTTQVGVSMDLAALSESVQVIPHDLDAAYRAVLLAIERPNHQVDLITFAWDRIVNECGILDALT